MKKLSIAMIAASAFIFACNDETSKDSVEKADSANEEKLDRTADSGVAAQGATTPVDEESAEFFVKAADGGMAEVAAAKIAQEKSSMKAVTEFAGMMVTDHTGANAGLKELAKKKNVTLPETVSEEHQKAAADLSKKTGKDFDKAYMDMQVKDHENTVKLFEKASGDVKDAEVKSFVDNTLPKLKAHLDAAKAIQKKM